MEPRAVFLCFVSTLTSRYSNAIFAKRKEAKKNSASQNQFPLSWTLDTTQFERISLKGFEAKHKPSSVTGLQRLYYDRNAAFVKPIKFFDAYKSDKVDAPYAYVIPQAWNRVIERLKWNGIEMKKLERDTMLDVAAYYITDFKTPPHASPPQQFPTDTQLAKCH